MKSVRHADKLPDHASYTVSGFFNDERRINEAMWECLRLGVPRDLMDVAVSPAAAQRFFGSIKPNRDGWFSWAGRGALAGLLLSAILTLGIVLLPGFNTSGFMAIVQFLGPDIGIILGGALGALYGWLRIPDAKPQLRRALDRTDAMLMLVHLQPQSEVDAIQQIFSRYDAESIQVDADSAKSVGAE